MGKQILALQEIMNLILEPIGYLRLRENEKCFLGARDKIIVFDVQLKKKKKKKNSLKLRHNYIQILVH